MGERISEQMGKILLVLAIAGAGFAIGMNPYEPVSFPEAEQIGDSQAVQVDWSGKPAEGTAALSEPFFAGGTREDYRGGERFVWVPERKVKEFEPINLDVPIATARVASPPQLLPTPGPGLEGTAGLPRWGEEFAPPKVEAPNAP